MDHDRERNFLRAYKAQTAALSEELCPVCKERIVPFEDVGDGVYGGKCEERGTWAVDGTRVSWKAP